MGMNDVHSLSHSKWNCKYHMPAYEEPPVLPGGDFCAIVHFLALEFSRIAALTICRMGV